MVLFVKQQFFFLERHKIPRAIGPYPVVKMVLPALP